MKPNIFRTDASSQNQATLKRSVELCGAGVHTGQLCEVFIEPAPKDTGFCFERDGVLIPARLKYVTDTRGAMKLSNHGVSVQTVEHLLAALTGLGFDNALTRVTGPELPILDGSARPWIKALRQAGQQRTPNAPRKIRELKNTLRFISGNSMAILQPSKSPSWSCHIAVGEKFQFASWKNNGFNFETEIGLARTYVEEKALSGMMAKGLLLGAKESSGILIRSGEPTNTTWRAQNECARHKILDAMGDFSLLGAHLMAKIQLWNNNHTLHMQLLKALDEKT